MKKKSKDEFLDGLDYRIKNIRDLLDSKVALKMSRQILWEYEKELDTTEVIKDFYLKKKAKKK